ncbi:NAD(+) diphosphatase [Amycolatopsis taiwanensis]|uniref:NAD(+) diphosphatase n=1 Tax=Amycolatopsis taiwanensis TaxID=342230 RepID=A0A9W6QX63_9PSEU|nr:NAD(+) diphosphatase [Amycolatopsis taiwanensis]GLY65358.1 NADH pyrophosphatase [Amycolatopsis taiwanensis]
MYYSGLSLDRAGSRRTDRAWLQKKLTDTDTQVIPLWRDNCLVRHDQPVMLTAGELPVATEDPVLLGLDGAAAVFAADLSELEQAEALEAAGADSVVDVRGLVATRPVAECGLLAYARGILHWQRNQQFCGACGGRTGSRDGGHLRVCRQCGKLLFPRIEPAVIVLVELPGEPRRCLLGQHRQSAPNRFSTLAGFVEIGESLEDAVRREVAEEAGVTVDVVEYQGSQSWPFPAGLMVGFRSQAVSETIAVDGQELQEARWFTAADLRARIADPEIGVPYRADSIGKTLIEDWLREND